MSGKGWMLVALASMGCAQVSAEDRFCEEYRCSEVAALAPSSDLSDAAAETVGRLAGATGRSDLAVSSDGIPVLFSESLVGQDELGNDVEACALTTQQGIPGGELHVQRIEIDPTPPDGCAASVVAQLLHETIHAMAPHAQHAADGHLFSTVIVGELLDEPSLESLCTWFDCLAFAPEVAQ